MADIRQDIVLNDEPPFSSALLLLGNIWIDLLTISATQVTHLLLIHNPALQFLVKLLMALPVLHYLVDREVFEAQWRVSSQIGQLTTVDRLANAGDAGDHDVRKRAHDQCYIFREYG